MTITCDEGQWWAECDACGDCHDLDGGDFCECVAEIRDAGWVVRLTGGRDWHWEHLCPGCRTDEHLRDPGEF